MTAAVTAPAAARGPLLRVARIAWTVALPVGAAWLAWSHRTQVGDLLDDARPGFLVLALGLGFLQLRLNAGFWTAGLRALGEDVSIGLVQRASARSLLARYVPGSIWYQLGRSALLGRQGIGHRPLAVVAVLDTVLGPVVGAALGVGSLLLGGGSAFGVVALIGWCGFLAAACSPPMVNAVLRLVARRSGAEALRLTWPAFLGLLARTAVFWLGAVAAFLAYLHAFPGLELPPLLTTAGSFMVAWVVGFLALFAPQGLGVFEAAFATAVADERISAVAVLVAGYRALFLVRDLVAVAWAELSTRRR